MRGLVLVAALVFGHVAHAATPTLIGGSPAPAGAYPEIVYIKDPASGARCSATIVSPKGQKGVILTAGHCVDNGGEIGPVSDNFTFDVAGRAYRAVCEQHPDYAKTGMDSDMALCLVNGVLDVEPATIGKVSPRVGEIVLLTGYGCTEPGYGTGGNDKILRIGKAKVTQAAGAGTWFYTRARSGASAALCFGDSGSSAQALPVSFKGGKGSEEEPKSRHVVLGTNSRGDIREVSMIASTALPSAQRFLKSWAVAKGVQICGVNKDC